jgi:EAL domain-containing protein (putative c-di-GMP-specific phosphodiesterase class I)/GGDEF domain-containing protein
LDERQLATHFQPIFDFRAGRFLGYEALVRGPSGSLLETPVELFRAAQAHDALVELNAICIASVLRAFSRSGLPGKLFLNISPQLIVQRGFDQERARRFMAGLGLDPKRVTIELTEDYPTYDFDLVRESLALYRSMGFDVAIDDLGEGFASLRLWAELRPEYVKADKHFVSGIAGDPVKVQFLRAIQHIAENCGSQVIAEGIESAADFKMAKDIGVAFGQGFFIGHPAEAPPHAPDASLSGAFADRRIPVVPVQRLRAGTAVSAKDFVIQVDAVAGAEPMSVLLERFSRVPGLAAIPVVTSAGVCGVVSRRWLERAGAGPGGQESLDGRPSAECADPGPVIVDAQLELAALSAILVRTDHRRIADGFVIQARGRYLGMGRVQDVLAALNDSQLLASRYTHPLTLLPGQVPINEHLERLLAANIAFSAWFAEVDQMRGVNDSLGFQQGDALIRAVGQALEGICESTVDFVGHIAGSRFIVLLQSDDWRSRADRAMAAFDSLLDAHIPVGTRERGYFTSRLRDGSETVRPLPKLAIGAVPVLPGLFESRHEVLAAAKQACREAKAGPTGGVAVDDWSANRYPRSLLLDGE